MDTQVYDTLEANFKDALQAISTEVLKAKQIHGSKRTTMLNNVQKQVEKAEKFIMSMEVETQTMASYETREKLKKSIQNYTKDLNKKKMEMRQLDEDESRYQLVSDMEFNSKEKSQERETKDYRERLAASTNSLDTTTARINNMTEVLAETEDVGRDTIGNLRLQREKMEKTIGTVRGIQTKAKEAGKVLFRMVKRDLIFNAVFCFIICLLLIVILVLLCAILWKPVWTLEQIIQNFIKQIQSNL